MRCSRGAVAPMPRRSGTFLQILNVIGVGLLVSACASSHASYDGHSNVGGPQSNQAGQVAMQVPKRTQLEADGLAVQAPPLKREQAEPDDPSEPFSPNYGPAPIGEPATVDPGHAAPVLVPAAQQRLPFRSRTRPMTHAQAEAIKVQAMVAHEQRNP